MNGKRETRAANVAAYLAEKYGFAVVKTPEDLDGVTMFLKNSDCGIRVSFQSYTLIADIDVVSGTVSAVLEIIVPDLERQFDFIDNVVGTVNLGQIRVTIALQ